MTQFEWLSDMMSPPARWDLRYLGWNLVVGADDLRAAVPSLQELPTDPGGRPVLLDWRLGCRRENWRDHVDPRWVIALGVDDSNDRAALIKEGLGEVLPSNVALVEIAARCLRLGANAKAISRYREAGPVMLDLFHRDGRIEQQWLGLHPREFGLFWRLAQDAGERVTKRELLADVWRMEHDPETNSVEVHISRLRAKLAISKVDWLVVTDPMGGYRLAMDVNGISGSGDTAKG